MTDNLSQNYDDIERINVKLNGSGGLPSQMIGSARRISLTPIISHQEVDLKGKQCVKQVNNYVLASKIGSGASSKVYLGIDEVTGDKYAVKRIKLKELSRTSSGIAQLEREIRLMRGFKHSNILKLKEALHNTTTHEAYLILEYAEKGSLGAFVERGDRLSHEAIFSIMKQVALAIKYLHEHGHVHQDIKPWNILLDGQGRALLADFGIGHSFQSAGMVVGSPAFQAPEALDDAYGYEEEEDATDYSQSDAGPTKEDIWALGVTLYQLLFLKLPFLGSNLYEIVNYIKENPLEIPEGTNPDVVDLLHSMLNVNPAKRISIDDLLANELIANASDYASDLPDVPKPKIIEGERIRSEAIVCPPDYSFVSVSMTIQRRLSFINAPYGSGSLNNKPFYPTSIPRTTRCFEPESSDTDDDDGVEICVDDALDRPHQSFMRLPAFI